MATRSITGSLRTSAFLRSMLVAFMASALLATLGGPATAASQGCSVKNKATGRTHTTLSSAVRAAKSGQKLLVRGTCRGKVAINKDLTIKGVGVGGRGHPAIVGWYDFNRILKVGGHATVTLQSLIIDSGDPKLPTRGGADMGGAIKNGGTLTLRDVVIRNYHAPNDGGGVFNRGSLILSGRTRITNNAAAQGGGVHNASPRARLVMNDSSRIVGNRGFGVSNNGLVSMNDRSAIARNSDGGVIVGERQDEGDRVVLNDSSRISGNNAGRYAGGGVIGTVVVMNDSSVISNNTAGIAAGVWADSLTMTGSSVIRSNTARRRGGGVYRSDEAQTLAGVTCGPGGNVYANTPDDCYIE